MRFVHFDSAEVMASYGANLVCDLLERKPDAHFCLATGASPAPLYEELARRAEKRRVSFADAWVTKLDEWLGVPPTHPASCERYLQERVIGPLNIMPERYLTFSGSTPDPGRECRLVQQQLASRPPIDMVILGVGANGHIGMNEPSVSLEREVHIATLSEETRSHTMLAGIETPPSRGITMGMSQILGSRAVLLLVSGEAKREALSHLKTSEATTTWPVTFLHLHQNAICLDDLPPESATA